MKTVNLTGYVLDEEGNIYGKSGKLLSQLTKDGRYLFVNLCNDGKMVQESVHRLMWIYHKGEIPYNMTIDHINGDKQDNRLVNLQLLTACDNSRKSNRVLPDEDIKLIKIYVRHKIPSVILSEFYNISQQTICDIKKGRRWADV